MRLITRRSDAVVGRSFDHAVQKHEERSSRNAGVGVPVFKSAVEEKKGYAACPAGGPSLAGYFPLQMKKLLSQKIGFLKVQFYTCSMF